MIPSSLTENATRAPYMWFLLSCSPNCPHVLPVEILKMQKKIKHWTRSSGPTTFVIGYICFWLKEANLESKEEDAFLAERGDELPTIRPEDGCMEEEQAVSAKVAMEKSFSPTTPTNQRLMISRRGSSPPELDHVHCQPQGHLLRSGILGMIGNGNNQRRWIGAGAVTRRWGWLDSCASAGWPSVGCIGTQRSTSVCLISRPSVTTPLPRLIHWWMLIKEHIGASNNHNQTACFNFFAFSKFQRVKHEKTAKITRAGHVWHFLLGKTESTNG